MAVRAHSSRSSLPTISSSAAFALRYPALHNNCIASIWQTRMRCAVTAFDGHLGVCYSRHQHQRQQRQRQQLGGFIVKVGANERTMRTRSFVVLCTRQAQRANLLAELCVCVCMGESRACKLGHAGVRYMIIIIIYNKDQPLHLLYKHRCTVMGLCRYNTSVSTHTHTHTYRVDAHFSGHARGRESDCDCAPKRVA